MYYFDDQILYFWKEQLNCDVYFYFEKYPEIQKIGAHKLILAISSSVFKEMLFGEFVHEEQICISDVEPKVFRGLLRYIYRDNDFFPNTPDEIVKFYSVAHKYNCLDALEMITKAMFHSSSQKIGGIYSTIPYYETAVMYDELAFLKRDCLSYISRDTTRYLDSKEFLDAKLSTVEAIFSLEDAFVDSEWDFVQALEAYIEHNEVSDPDIREKVRPALKSIRFLTLTPSEVAETTLLTKKEAKKIIKCISNPDNLQDMPAGFAIKERTGGSESDGSDYYID